MLNEPTIDLPDDAPALRVMEGLSLQGQVNTADEILRAHVASAIRRGYPQIRPDPPRYDRVCIVGGGPSLASTEPELRQLVLEGAVLVTLNGAHQWALERNYRPQIQIVMDARESNARFLFPVTPRCRYVLASQCHPAVWDAVAGRDNVWIFHASVGGDDILKQQLDAFYLGNWVGIGGGTTVGTRAISLLRTLGYLRFDGFGLDSCWMNGQHHAYPQEENARDRRYAMKVSVAGSEDSRTFLCSPWHAKQAEDFAQLIRFNGHQFLLSLHGDGLLAYILRASADATDLTFTAEQE